MKNLREDVAALFAELNGYDDEDDAIFDMVVAKRAAAVERTRMWRIQNPAKNRARKRRERASYAKRNRDKVLARKRRQYAKRAERDREKLRAIWRRNSAAKRARDAKR